MIQSDVNNELLNAVRILLIYTANIKYGLKENLSNPFVQNSAVETVNKVIADKFKVDLKKIKKPNELNLYEFALNDYLNSILRQIKGPEIIKDQTELLNKSKSIYNSKILSEGFILDPKLDESSKKLKITQPTLKSWLKNISHIEVIDDSDSLRKNYFATSKIHFRNRERILISHLFPSDGKNNSLVLNSFFLFSYEEYADMYIYPTRLFLKAIDYYGLNIEIGEEIKKFWYQVKIPKGVFGNGTEFFRIKKDNKKDAMTIWFTSFDKGDFMELYFVYSINHSLFIREFLHDEI